MNIWANNRARILVTSKCNINCTYCHNEGQPKEHKFISINLVNRISELMQANDKKLDSITFSGGEALLHNNIFQIIEKLSRFSLKSTLVTNGLLLDERMLQKITESGISKIRLGIDSINKPKSRPTSGRKPKMPIHGVIEMLMKSNTNFELNVVLSKYNLTEIGSIIQFCVQNRISAKFFELVKVEEFGNLSNKAKFKSIEAIPYQKFEEIVLKYTTTMSYADDMGASDIVFDGSGDGFSLRYCHYLCDYNLCYKTGTRIDADGSVYTCMGQRGKLWINELEPIQHSITILEKAIQLSCNKIKL